MMKVLSTKNIELEYEVKRLNEVNNHLENMDNIYIMILRLKMNNIYLI